MNIVATIFLTLILFSNSAYSSNVDWDIKIISDKMYGSYFSQSLPKPYSDISLPENEYPVFSQELNDSLASLEKNSFDDWQNFVEAQWQFSLEGEYTEFDFKDERTKDYIKTNPNPFLGLPDGSPLNTIENISALFKDFELIGYVVELSNSVRSSIIEDGSGYVIYLDKNLKIILITDWDA